MRQHVFALLAALPAPTLPPAGWRRGAGIALLCCASGCGSLLNVGSAELAGVSGAAIAGAVTDNAAAATGIGLGVQAAGRATLQFAQRRVHRAVQDRIAEAAGDLQVGAVAHWRAEHRLPLERDEQGRVTVSRVISTQGLHCKEVVFSVDQGAEQTPARSWFAANVCRQEDRWKWAAGEPAVERWGNLQ